MRAGHSHLRRRSLSDTKKRNLFGLAPGGVCQASPSPDCWCALTAPFHPYPAAAPFDKTEPGLTAGRYLFCGTFPGVTSGGCYPPPCPAEPGLSSPISDRSDHPAHSGQGKYSPCKPPRQGEIPSPTCWQARARGPKAICQNLSIFRQPRRIRHWQEGRGIRGDL